ncbi:hypothetical protein PTNB73_00123 [Pyrenophora teres f. teres]|nr:hypothetical protein HRS9139_01366 [Pyrenophora teres f. teres]KAE8851106.1 hypothetical protein HRS9122_01393 [Pyrenophora teres f. teres]KAE8873491.1 hypothetical protein PTNB73_00123 [Pyrenophora teres f. teres]
MVEFKVCGSSDLPGSTGKPGGGRLRIISSCLTCRRRKVKCDHVHPICGSCNRGNHACTWSDRASPTTATGRISKPTFAEKSGKSSDVQARLDRLEYLLERAVAGQGPNVASSIRSSAEYERREDALTPSSNSQTSHGGGIASDDGDGTLLLNGGQAQFVSSLHFALLADEFQDIKALLGDKTDEEKKEVPQNTLIDLLSLGRAGSGSNLGDLLPSTQEHRDFLLEVYFTSVDPMVRVTHRPTVIRKMHAYDCETHPMAYAIYYSAINALSPKAIGDKFGESKKELLDRYQLGIEISLARENYLTTSDLEILQAFVIWLSCITREEEMGKAWVLIGIAFRIALNQGLHRDPSLFPAGSMDVITIELRRRVWHQLGHLEFRAAECKGQEPSITEDFYTTLFPRNIDDEDLVDGASPGLAPYDESKFTTMTFQIIRFNGMRALRRIIQSTYRLERRMLDSGLNGTSPPNPAVELRTLYEQIKVMLDEIVEENQQKYLRHLNPEIPMQRLTLGLVSLLEWRAYLLFWLRMPRAYRDVVFADDIRRSIFEKSISCVEALNVAAADIDAARFQWHIGGIASFQAIMHILSELRNPLFDVPERQRALRAIQMSRLLRENNTAKAWQAVKNMIDKAIAEHNLSPQSSSHTSAHLDPSTSKSVFAELRTAASYTYPRSVASYDEPPVSAPPPPPPQLPLQLPQHTMQPQPDPMQDLQSMQNQMPCWDDFNLSNINNIVGDVLPNADMVPDFDFGFWGDPFNYEIEPAAMQIQDSYLPQWMG